MCSILISIEIDDITIIYGARYLNIVFMLSIITPITLLILFQRFLITTIYFKKIVDDLATPEEKKRLSQDIPILEILRSKD